MGRRGPGAHAKGSTKHPAPRVVSFPIPVGSRDDAVIEFVQKLPVTKGLKVGNTLELLPFQVEFVRALYGDDSRVRIALQSIPRGNGKTGLEAALCLAHMFGPVAEPRGELYAAGIDRVQSSLMFDEIAAVIEDVPEFMQDSNILKWQKRIEVVDGPGKGTIFQALSSDIRRGHGVSPTFVVADEMGTWNDLRLWEGLITAMGKRKRALAVGISTQAGSDQHPFSLLVDDAARGLDPTVYCQLICAPEEADPFSEETWLACNPALGSFLSLEEFRSQAERAKRVATFEPVFRNLRLNQRVAVSETWLSQADWNRCRIAFDPLTLMGQSCVGGLDLGSTRDLTSFSLFFEETGHLLNWSWCPGETIDEREHTDRAPYRVWADRGVIELTPGRALDKAFVTRRLGDIFNTFRPRLIAFDRWGISELERLLEDEGIDLPLKEFGQGFKDMSPATKAFELKVLNGDLKQNGNPLLDWCLSNVRLERDAADGVKPSKKRSHERIDPIVASIMAVGIGVREPVVQPQEFRMLVLGGGR